MTTMRAVELDNLATMLVRQEAAFKAQQESTPPAPAAVAPAKQ
jgi:hypothetical protein